MSYRGWIKGISEESNSLSYEIRFTTCKVNNLKFFYSAKNSICCRLQFNEPVCFRLFKEAIYSLDVLKNKLSISDLYPNLYIHITIESYLEKSENFNFFLTSLEKLNLPEGLLEKLQTIQNKLFYLSIDSLAFHSDLNSAEMEYSLSNKKIDLPDQHLTSKIIADQPSQSLNKNASLYNAGFNHIDSYKRKRNNDLPQSSPYENSTKIIHNASETLPFAKIQFENSENSEYEQSGSEFIINML